MANYVGTLVSRSTVGPLSFGADPGDSVFIAVTAERGLSDYPHLVTSFDRYRQVFGGADGVVYTSGTRMSEADEVLNIFFSKGTSSKRVYAVRLVDAAAVQANVLLVDRAGAPLNTLTVHAKGEGTWANAIDIVIADGTRSNTFKLTVKDGDGNTLETWDNLVMTDASLQTVTDGSDYVYLENEDSATAAPNNRPANGTFDLNDTQVGVDGNDPLAADIVGAEALGVKSGLKVFRDTRFGRGFIVAPGLDSDSTVRTEMAAQLDSHFHVPLFGAPAGKTATTVQSDPPDELAGYYWPLPKVQDAITDELRTISPVGHVLADWFTFLARQDYGKHPAGRDFRVDRVVGIEAQANGLPLVDPTVAETVLAVGVNPIYDRDGTGLRVWGARTCSTDPKWAYLHAVYLWARIASQVQAALDNLIYDTADAGFFEDVRAGVFEFMVSLANGGAFDGQVPAPGEEEDPDNHAFGVRCDRALLSPSDIENKIIRVKVWFKDSLTAETIYADVAKRSVA